MRYDSGMTAELAIEKDHAEGILDSAVVAVINNAEKRKLS